MSSPKPSSPTTALSGFNDPGFSNVRDTDDLIRRQARRDHDKARAAKQFPHKADERALLVSIYRHCGKQGEPAASVRDICRELHDRGILHWKRAEAILDKFDARDFHNWGVSIFAGWLEPAGRKRAAEIEAEAVALGYHPLYAFLRPGSIEARHEGCKCPVWDNAHGAGIPGSQKRDASGFPTYANHWIMEHCPIHGTAAQAAMKKAGIVL